MSFLKLFKDRISIIRISQILQVHRNTISVPFMIFYIMEGLPYAFSLFQMAKFKKEGYSQ